MATVQHDPAFERGLPANPFAERMVLGSVLLNDATFLTVSSVLSPEDFSLEKHRKIFRRMLDLHGEGQRIDRVTLANALMKHGELESVDGIAYLISLDEGLPELHHLEDYVNIVKEKAILRRIIETSQQTIQNCMLGEMNSQDVIGVAEEQLLTLGQANIRNTLISAAEVIEGTEGGINSLLDPARRVHGTSTGFERFDEMTGGLRGGELIILAARPAMGKTALALNIGLHIATRRENPQTVAVFSLEMSKESLLTRLICSLARVDQQKYRLGFLEEDDIARLSQAAHRLYEAPLFLDDNSNTTLLEMNAKLRKLKQQHGLGLVIVDYLQLMPAPSLGRNSNRVLEVGALSRGLKLMSKELDVPFLVLSQLSRAPEQRVGDFRPQLSDLRESGSIEQDADLVMFIFRPEVYHKEREDLRGVAELIVAKQRNGPTGKVPLVFLHAYTRFESRMDEDYAPAE
jgi:replicative DNA helicase